MAIVPGSIQRRLEQSYKNPATGLGSARGSGGFSSLTPQAESKPLAGTATVLPHLTPQAGDPTFSYQPAGAPTPVSLGGATAPTPAGATTPQPVPAQTSTQPAPAAPPPAATTASQVHPPGIPGRTTDPAALGGAIDRRLQATPDMIVHQQANPGWGYDAQTGARWQLPGMIPMSFQQMQQQGITPSQGDMAYWNQTYSSIADVLGQLNKAFLPPGTWNTSFGG